MSGKLKQKFEKKISAKLAKDLGIKNKMAVPRVEKVVVNLGVGELLKNKEAMEQIKNDISKITGQVPSVRLAKISVAGFGVREGMPVGLKVTLRGVRMYDFLEKLFSIVLPRLRDFRGLSLKSFDANGNYTIGLSEHTVFPEIDSGKIATPRGLEVTVVTSTRNKDEARMLLEELGMPFEKEGE